MPKGGPDGGNGGRGGDIVFLADANLRTLMDFRYKRKYEAENGEDGRGRKQYGKDGEDMIIKVPQGTLIKDAESGTVLADLTRDGERFVAAKGGKGGKGNFMFRTSVRQAPNFAEAGGFSSERAVELELKLIADVGLIGFPNAGKSTLLSVATNASPKIADYHFTTLTPNLGVVKNFDDAFVIADIPGLIEGASSGMGLGLDFLKHIERTRVLIHVVDVSGSEGRDPCEDFDTINRELVQYSEKLLEKPQILAANKIDLLGNPQNLEKLKAHAEKAGIEVFPVSAAAHKGIKELLSAVQKLLAENPPEDKEVVGAFEPRSPEEEPGYRDIDCGMEGGVYFISGKQLEKIFNSTNFNDAGSVRYLHRYIEDSGVVERLKKLGLSEGDTIRIFNHEYEYIDE